MQVRYNIVKCRTLPIITCICVLRERYELPVNVNVSRSASSPVKVGMIGIGKLYGIGEFCLVCFVYWW